MNKWELEARLLFAIIVAGKSEKFARGAVVNFLIDVAADDSPFRYLRRLNEQGLLEEHLRAARTGSYKRIFKAFVGVMNLDAANCTIEQLEGIHGIGPKTSRFYLMWTRPGVKYAALDRHVLKWMDYLGYKVPQNTPTGEKYLKIERQFLAEAEERNMTPRQLDAIVWDFYSGGGIKKKMPPGLRPKKL